ncbi:MAG TPA: divalent metal cation transporter [Spirochaetia bacterium]|nr:divalent metal cation transporter [Spirochaetia bacterium]
MAVWSKVRRFFGKIGPGFVTGAADDDPSGVATYSIAGAQHGYKMSWMTLFLIPAMVAIQEMCGRIGMVTGRGLAGVIKKYHSKSVMWFAVMLLAVANTINIGADFGIMAASLQMLFGLPYFFWILIIAGLIIYIQIRVSYKQYSKVLKWLGLTLLVYMVTALMVKQDWKEIAISTLVPHVEFNMIYLMTLVGFLGTSISPYLFFWQASGEVEEEIAKKKIADFDIKPKISKREIFNMGVDTKIGMIFSSAMAFFIVLTTASTLHNEGVFSIETPQQAAMALRPLAGDLAYVLFAIGIIGIGLQSIPVLAGSVGYAVSDALGIEEGLSKKFSKAKGFYLIIVASTIIGVLINLLGINTMQALYYAAIINGTAAVPLIFIIIKLSGDKKIVGEHRSKSLNRVIAWITFVFMAIAVALMVASFFGFTF